MKKVSIVLCLIILLTIACYPVSALESNNTAKSIKVNNIYDIPVNSDVMEKMVKNEIALYSVKDRLQNKSNLLQISNLYLNIQDSQITVSYQVNNNHYTQKGKLYYDKYDLRYDRKLFADMQTNQEEYSVLSVEIYGDSLNEKKNLLVNSSEKSNGILLIIEDSKNKTLHYITGNIERVSINNVFANKTIIEDIPDCDYFELTNIYLKSKTYSKSFIESSSSKDFENTLNIEETTSTNKKDTISSKANAYDSKNEWIRLFNDLKAKSNIYPSSYNLNTAVLKPTGTTVGQAQWDDNLQSNFGIVRLGYYDINQNKYNIYVSFIELMATGQQSSSKTADLVFEFGFTNPALNMHGFHACYWRNDGRLQYIYNKGLKFKNIKVAIGNVHKNNMQNVIYEVTQEYRIRSYSSGSLYSLIKNNPAATAIANIAIAKLSKTAGVVSSIITSLDFDNPANICTKKYYTTYTEQIANYGNKAIRCAGVGSGSYYIYEKNDYLRVSTKVNTPAGSTSWTRSYSYTVYN